MNETAEPTNNVPENPVAETSDREEEEVIFQPQNELPFPTETDLNEIFPEEDKDLNDLFPDEETRLLLKKMQKNKKDLHTMKDRFLEEDWSEDAPRPDDREEGPAAETQPEE